MKNKPWVVGGIVIVAIIVIAVIINNNMSSGEPTPNNNDGEMVKTNLIEVESPRINAEIASPLTIKGEARGTWYFEASFPARLLDGNGKEIALMPIMTSSEWMTENFVPFEALMTFEMPRTTTGTLILHKDNPSGLPEYDDEVRIPVRFKSGGTPTTPIPSGEMMTVKAFFNNSNLDPAVTCTKVFPVTREVPKTSGVARVALTELLKGPTSAEKDKGYTTSINLGVNIISLTIQNGVAKVDLSTELGTGVAGSCRVGAIRAQIEETLKQFSTVTQVIISINGESEDILQP